MQDIKIINAKHLVIERVIGVGDHANEPLRCTLAVPLLVLKCSFF